MATCAGCGNDYDEASRVVAAGGAEQRPAAQYPMAIDPGDPLIPDLESAGAGV